MDATPNPSFDVLFVGLGQMGQPMAAQLLRAGVRLRGVDPSGPARQAFAAAGGDAVATPAEAAAGANIVIAMLPDGKVVREVLLGSGGLARALAARTLIIDMSSSAPAGTVALGAELGARGLMLIDAPVSGGVRRARDGSLAIMVGGAAADIARARPLLEAMGKQIFHTGRLGSAHAMKALNNYVSAAGLVAACEALLVGQRFGIEPDILLDVLNASTGRNNSTEVKMKQFVVSESFASGFSLGLMAKDLRTAADLAAHLRLPLPQIASSAALWEAAREALGPSADHTAIHRFLVAMARGDDDLS